MVYVESPNSRYQVMGKASDEGLEMNINFVSKACARSDFCLMTIC